MFLVKEGKEFAPFASNLCKFSFVQLKWIYFEEPALRKQSIPKKDTDLGISKSSFDIFEQSLNAKSDILVKFVDFEKSIDWTFEQPEKGPIFLMYFPNVIFPEIFLLSWKQPSSIQVIFFPYISSKNSKLVVETEGETLAICNPPSSWSYSKLTSPSVVTGFDTSEDIFTE